MLDTSMKS